LKRVFADFGRPDVVHIQSTIDAGILAFEHLVSMKIPYVITEHGSFFRRHMVPDWKLPLVKKCFGNACASFAVSNSLIADLQTIGVEAKIGIMPNTYDSELFNIEGAQRSEIFTFVMVCALHESLKGVDIAVEAFAKLLQHHDDCRLIIAGAGPDAVQIDQRIDRLGIASNTKTIGPQSRADVARLMKKSHCIVSASRVETFGVTLIEGLACGLAAVATRSGGPEDFIVAPHGVLVPVNDPERLAIAMRDTLENYDSSADARVARNEYVTRNYSKQAFYSRIAPVYDRVCACGKPGAAAGSSSN
jgi:glycosyltransferase involved in cell wall biosynthesis